MQVVILCGGKGTRLGERGRELPKALVPIGGRPILRHIMQTYIQAGHTRFILCLGHLGDRIREHFLSGARPQCSVRLAPGAHGRPDLMASGPPHQPQVLLVETGVDTSTGSRLRQVQPYIDGDSFFLTYADGLADLDMQALLRFHRGHGRIATVTAVRPRLPFGLICADESGRVRAFQEKPRIEGWANGGFFLFKRDVLPYIDGEGPLEEAPLRRLASEGELMAYFHAGFWKCLDTWKDQAELDALCAAGQAPWLGPGRECGDRGSRAPCGALGPGAADQGAATAVDGRL